MNISDAKRLSVFIVHYTENEKNIGWPQVLPETMGK
jgi:hypothetical protein